MRKAVGSSAAFFYKLSPAFNTSITVAGIESTIEVTAVYMRLKYAKYMEIASIMKAMDLFTFRLVLSLTAVMINVIMVITYRTIISSCTYISYPGVIVLILPW